MLITRKNLALVQGQVHKIEFSLEPNLLKIFFFKSKKGGLEM